MNTTASPPPTALQTLPSALLALHDAHPFTTALLLTIYASGVLIYTILLCASLHDPRTIPWLSPVFLTDGVLVCCCPLAAVLPVLLWPLVVACGALDSCLRWFLAAPTFCGVRRETFARLCRARSRRDRKQRRSLLPVAGDGRRHAPRAGYGALDGRITRVERDHYPTSRSQRMQYARQPQFQSDVASVSSAPPPYQE